jgi:bifunctional non-homologous end joining protein LigD
MLGLLDFCIPTKSISVPSGPDWLHETDGYRLRVERNGDRVRLIALLSFTFLDLKCGSAFSRAVPPV